MNEVRVIVMWDEDDGTLRLEVDVREPGSSFYATEAVLCAPNVNQSTSRPVVRVMNDTEEGLQ